MAKAKPKAEIPKNIPFWQNDKVMAWIFFGIAFLLYAQTISYDYAIDDIAVIRGNDFVHKGFGGFGSILKTFYWAGCPNFATANSGLFRPLSLLLFATEWKLFPDHPHVYHFVNVVLYAISAFLLYKTLRELFRNFSLTLPVLATLIWIVFPAHTEVVANIKSADELLSMIFFLLSIRQLMKWSENKMMKPLLLSGTFFFLALLAKEGAVLFLPVMFIAIYLFRKIETKEFIKPALVLVGVTAVWLLWHVAVISNAPSKPITYDYTHNSLFAAPDLNSRIATAMQMQGKYLLKSFTGYPLSWDYSYNENPNTTFADIWVLISILVCAGLFIFAILQFKKNPVLSFGILFYFITFALTSNVFVLIGATMADRFLFVPSLGFAIALTWGILKLTKGENVKYFHANAMYILLPLALFYGIRTYSRSADWKDEPTLFQADVENAPGSGRVHANSGILFMNSAFAQKDENQKALFLDKAYEQFFIAAKIDSLDYKSQLCLGQVEYNRKNYEASAAWSRKNIATFRILNVPPNDISVYKNLGNALMMMGKYDSARVAFNEGIKVNPGDASFYNQVGNSYLAAKDTVNAIVSFENAVTANPKSIESWDKLANVCGMSRKYERSNEAFLELTKLDPANPHPYQMLSINYKMMKDSTASRQWEEEYLRRSGK